MSREFRDEAVLRHFASRCGQKNPKQPEPAPLKMYVVYDNSDWGDSQAPSNWIKMGTSPVISAYDKMQARRRFQTFMSDN